jgi:hypothetical protein
MSLDVVPGPAVGGAGDVRDDVTAAPSGTQTSRGATPWGLVAALSLCLAGADMFHVISLQGAVGSIERNQSAFELWLRISALSLPFFVAAVVLSLRVARRRVAPSLRTLRTLVPAAVLLVLATSVVGLGAAAANAAVDYRLQAAAAVKTAATHAHGATAADGTGRNNARCVGACKAKRDTFKAHAKGLGLVTPVMLGTNLVVVAWVVALAGGSLDPRRRRTA